MAWYRASTISLTNGSTAVTGAATDFIANCAVGEGLLAPDGKVYEIAAIVSATSLTLGSVYLGSTASGQSYAIIPSQSYLRDLALQAATLVNDYQSVLDSVGAGKFDDGTLGSPGIQFASDSNTGLRRTGTDAVALVTGGVDRITVDAAGAVAIPGAVDINGGTIDGTVIGGSSAAAGSFTTLSASDSIRGGSGATYKFALDYSVSGDVAGELANSHASGYGYRIKGGTTSNYALLVQSQDSTNILEAKKGSVAVTGELSATGKATLGPTSGEQVALSNGAYASSLNYLQSYGDGTPRIRLGHYDSSLVAFPTGLVPSQILAGVTALDISSRDIGSSQINLRAGAGVPVVATVSSTGLAVTGALSATTADGVVNAKLISPSGITRHRYIDATSGNALESNNVAESAYIPFSITGSTVRINTGSGMNAAIFDASGNLGLGVTPSAWYQGSGTGKAFQVGASTALYDYFATGNTQTRLYNNASFNGAGIELYLNSNNASKYAQLSGTHSWYTAPSGTAGNAITFTQGLSFGHGTTLALAGATSVTGSGISFPATQVASSDANTLDDYEEGTWTPSIGGTATYTIQEGYYRKVGQLVYIQCKLSINALGTGNTSILSGLPFTSINSAQASTGALTCSYFASLAVNTVVLTPVVSNSTATISFAGIAAPGATMSSELAVFGGSTRIDFSGCYLANT